MKTTLASYLYSRKLITKAKSNKLKKIEDNLTTDNFLDQATAAYTLIFGEKPDPVVFTGHKFFLTKVIHPLFARVDLMEKGLHIFRIVFARHAHNLRPGGFKDFESKGIKTYRSFLSKTDHKKVLEEISKFPLSENIQPSNNRAIISKHINLEKLIQDAKIFNTCVKAVHREETDAAARAHFEKTTYVQRLVNAPKNGDIQKVCHSDVFYPCVKYWYFPEEVTVDNGPFMYAKGSTQITDEMLDFFYRESVAVTKTKWVLSRNKGHGEGSFRALPEDLKDMNLKLEPITVKANSLVIADTSGFHCRGDAMKKHIRSALHGAIRVETAFDA